MTNQLFDPPQDGQIQSSKAENSLSSTSKKSESNSTLKLALIFSYIYFLEGIPYGIQSDALPIFFKSVQNLNFSLITLSKFTLTPWLVKPFITRKFNLESPQKCFNLLKLMLKLSIILSLTASLFHFNQYLNIFIIQIFFHSLVACLDIAADYLQVCSVEEISNFGLLKSLEVCCYKGGAFIAGSLFISKSTDFSKLYLLVACLYLIGFYVVGFMPDSLKGDSEKENEKTQQPEKDKEKEVQTENKQKKHPEEQNDHVLNYPLFIQFLLVQKIFGTAFKSILPIYLLENKFSREFAAILAGHIPLVISTFGSFLGGTLQKFRYFRNFSVSKLLKWTTFLVSLQGPFVYFYFKNFSQASQSQPNLLFTSYLITLMAFFGGAQTTLVFIKMAEIIKSSEKKFSNSNSNEIYCWFCSIEIIGKLSCSIFIGFVADWVGYEQTILVVCLFQLYSLYLVWFDVGARSKLEGKEKKE